MIWDDRVAGAAALGALELAYGQEQSQTFWLASHQEGIMQGRRCSHVTWSLDQGGNEGGKGCTIPHPTNYWGAPKSPSNVSSTFFNTVHSLPKNFAVGSNMGAPNLFLAPGAI